MRDYTEEIKPFNIWAECEDEYKCDCSTCDYEPCIHREAYRRLPVEVGGLGLCFRLKGWNNEQ